MAVFYTTSFTGVITYLAEEENTTPKYGAIAIGGLAGYIFGLRGGLFRRAIYGTVGALGMASICYPKEASQYYQLTVLEVKRYAVIGYNFAYGGKHIKLFRLLLLKCVFS